MPTSAQTSIQLRISVSALATKISLAAPHFVSSSYTPRLTFTQSQPSQAKDNIIVSTLWASMEDFSASGG